MKNIKNLSLSDFVGRTLHTENFNDELVIAKIDGHQSLMRDNHLFPLRLNAHSVVLVCQGEMTIELDYQSYTLHKNDLLEVVVEDIVEGITMSSDFIGYHIMYTIDLMMSLLLNLSPRSPYDMGRLKRIHPRRELTELQMQQMLGIVEQIRYYIANDDHIFRSAVIRNELFTFILELDNQAWQRYGYEQSWQSSSGIDELKFRFIRLMVDNCRHHRDVAFYAEQLCITPDYLSRVMRGFSGKSASDWISHAVIVEAKFLLHNSELTVQQIAEIMNFSDQSSFGKFFKRHTGKSPTAYFHAL